MLDETVLSARFVSKSYSDGEREISVLSDLNFDLHIGEWVAIVGASGSGKSTLLNLLGGLDDYTSGEILVAGRSLGQMKDRDRSIWRNQQLGFVFQMHHLLPEFNALEGVAMPARIGGASKKDAMERAAALLERLGMGARLNHHPASLSGGERQRVAIARALVNNPICVLMDEPTGNLDPETADQVLEAMTCLRDSATAFVVVTHDPRIAVKMDCQYTLMAGRLEKE